MVFADIFSAKTRKNLKENNKICILVGDHKKMVGYQFAGEAELMDQGELFDAVCKGVASLNLPKPTYAVKIKITDIYPMTLSM
ncbi:MAG: pyridoxamine 5'-phosphate oxidase family protein [Desulfitobacteriaceae bacterium]|nr:pyridoxamine 5'-phosphate oxidase family protein [Desulfitobacteriaceae bacterium]